MKGPKKSILSQAQEQSAPTPQAGAVPSQPTTGANPPPPPAKAGDTASNSGNTSTSETEERVAVLSLSMVGEIMSARQACRALFGREANLLVGQNIRVLLKGGLDNEVGRFLLKYQTGESAGGTSLLNVIALRKDGTEFQARVTTQTWSWDKDVAKKGDTSARNWTAIFRDLTEAPAAPTPTAAPAQEKETDSSQPEVKEASEASLVSAPAPISAPGLASALSAASAPTPAPAAQRKLPAVRPPVAQAARPAPETPRAAAQPERVVAPQGRPRSEPLEAAARPAPPTAALEGVAVELSKRFEEQLAALRQEREELKSKLATEQSTAALFKRRMQELQGQGASGTGGSGQAGTETEKPGLSQFELSAQLDAAKEAAGFAEAALKEETARREKLEEQLRNASSGQGHQSAGPQSPELTSLRRERDELRRNLLAQQQAGAEAARRAQALEASSGAATPEFERVKSELAGLTAARDRVQAEWRQQLTDAQAVNSTLEKSLGEALARNNSHEGELAKLKREYAELTSKLADHELAAAQSQLLTGDAKGGKASADAKRASVDLEKLSADRKRAEAQWRAQLDAANELKARTEDSLFKSLERLKARELEVAKVRQERDELLAKLGSEQQVLAQLKQRVEQFEAQSRKSTGDLDQAKAEHERAHLELRAQIDAAKEAASRAEAALKEEVARRQKLEEQLRILESGQKQVQAERTQHFEKELGGLRQERDGLKSKVATLETRLQRDQNEQTERDERLDEELSSLRKERDELKTKLDALQKAVTEANQRAEELAGRVSQNSAESERTRNELTVKAAERDRERDDMRVELAGAHAARTRLETSLGDALERGNRFEAEVTQVRRELEDLGRKLASEQKATAEARRRAEQFEKQATGAGEAALKKEIARREQLEQRLKTLSSGLKEEQAERKKRFDKELSSLRLERDALDAKLVAEQKEATESVRRAQELERRLTQNASEFERAKTELEQLSSERQRAETVWREQLDTAFIAKKELAGAWAGAVEQNKRLEEDLSKLRKEQEELAAKLAAEQQVVAQSKNRASDVEGLLTRNASESERVRAELEKQNAEMERMQAEWRQQLDAAEAAKASLEASLEEARERSKGFEHEVAALQQERDTLHSKFTAEHQAAAESTHRAQAAESQLNQRAIELERVQVELQQQRAKLQESEDEWRHQLEAAQARKTASAKGVSEELAALRRERDGLHTKLTAQLQAAEESSRRVLAAESQLNQRATELERVQVELQQQRAKLQESEAEWRKQLETAQAKKASSAKGTSGELAALRRERDGLHTKLTAQLQAAAESTRRAQVAESQLNQRATELERVKAELQQQRAALEESEAEWRKQLETAQAKKTASSKGASEGLAAIRRERDGLQAKLTAQLQAAAESQRRVEEAESQLDQSAAELERVSAELEQQRAQFEQAESQWRLQVETAQEKQTASTKGVADELAILRQERDGLQGKLTAQLQAAEESQRRAQEAESQLDQNAAELERVNTELEQQRTQLERAEAQWRRQLETAQTKKTESARGNGAELAALRRERDELQSKLAAELRAAAESKRRTKDSESQVRVNEAELERLNAEVKRLAANLEHSESKWRRQSEAAQAQKLESQKILAAADDCNRRLEKELTELQHKYERLAGKAKPEPPAAPRPTPRTAPVDSYVAPRPAAYEPGQPVAQNVACEYPAQIGMYEFDVPRSQPVREPVREAARRTREARGPARRRRQSC